MTRLAIIGISLIIISLMFVNLSDAEIDEESLIGMWRDHFKVGATQRAEFLLLWFSSEDTIDKTSSSSHR